MGAQLGIVLSQHKMDQFYQRPGKLNPRRPTADDNKCHQRPFAGRIRFNDRPLEGCQDVVAQCFGIRQFLEIKGMAFHRFQPKIICDAAGTDHEIVVWDESASGSYFTRSKIDPHHLRQMKACPRPTAGHGTHRMGD